MHVTDTPAPIHLAVVLDRSGSMASIADDMVGGFNTFLAEQRGKPGQCAVTLVQFDGKDPFEFLVDGMPLAEVTDLDRSRYVPRDMTPLLDAVGRMIAHVDARQSARPDEDQVVLIITDGLENASREFSYRQVAELIKAREEKGWAFVFLGSDAEVMAEAVRMGTSAANRAQWAKSSAGTKLLWEETSDAMTTHRSKAASLRKMDSMRMWEERERRNREEDEGLHRG